MKNWFDFRDDQIWSQYQEDRRLETRGNWIIFKNMQLWIIYLQDAHPKNQYYLPHAHPQFEVYYFIDGKGTYRIEGNTYPLQKGDLLLLRPGEVHNVDIMPSVPYTRMAVHFDRTITHFFDRDDRLLAPFLDRPLGQQNLYRSFDFRDASYQQYIQHLMSDCDDRYLNTVTYLFPLLNEILFAFRRKTLSEGQDSMIDRVVQYINNNLTNPLSLETICDACYVSKTHLCYKFKEKIGTTVLDYIVSKRLLLAYNRIMNGERPTDVYQSCGFVDYSTFFRTYKKTFGFSPSVRQPAKEVNFT